MNSLTHNTSIYNFLNDNGIISQLSKPAVKHIESFMSAAISKGFNGKTIDVQEFSSTHRTAFGHFLSYGKWDEAWLASRIKESIVSTLSENSTNQPILVSIDDTVNCKTKPSLQALAPMQGTGYHHSSLEKRRVWGHKVQAFMMSRGDISLNYDIHLYDKKGLDKIAYAINMAFSLPVFEQKSYALFDSWYTCPKVIEAFESRGYYCIGALKTNRIIYPSGVRISLREYAKDYIRLEDVRLVTVNQSQYYVYRYEGALNGIANATVLISWPVRSFKDIKKMKAFISTDMELSTEKILSYYTSRWKIEIFFKQQKMNLGFDKYQIRSQKGIQRYLILISYVHLFCTLGLGEPKQFGKGLREIRERLERHRMRFFYKCGQNNIPFHYLEQLLAS